MNARLFETLIGAIVVLVAIVFTFVIFQSAGGSSSDNRYRLSAEFFRAEGIMEGTDVRLAGISIGKVSNMVCL